MEKGGISMKDREIKNELAIKFVGILDLLSKARLKKDISYLKFEIEFKQLLDKYNWYGAKE